MRVRCEHPVWILDQNAKRLFLRSGRFFNVANELVRVSEVDSHEERQMLKYVYRNKPSHPLEHSPYVVDNQGCLFPLFRLVSCGRCRLCREKKSNEWSTRVALECEAYDDLPLMLTLTYRNEDLPTIGLDKPELQKFFKRLRINLHRRGFGDKIRYIAVGEYGSKRHRPHYHLLVFGLDKSLYYWNYYEMRNCPNRILIDLLNDSWKHGFVYPMFCNNAKAGRYVVKYMRKGTQCPDGKTAGFFLSSRRDGAIGWRGFIYHGLDKQLRENPSAPTISYIPRHGDGNQQNLCVPYYFLQKVFPSLSQLYPAVVQRKVRSYVDSLNYLRERPLLGVRKAWEQLNRMSMYDSAIVPLKVVRDRFNCSPLVTTIKVETEYLCHSVSDAVFSTWQRLYDDVLAIQRKIVDLPFHIAYENERLRRLYLDTRSVADYDISAEVAKYESRSRKLFESEKDLQ